MALASARCMASVMLGMLIGCWAATPANAQSGWPEKPITLIVPFPPGGVADTVARPVADALSKELKQTVIVDNRVGAGGALGMGAAARAPADGYTLLMTLSSISILPEADKILGRKPAYLLNQFRPIARFTADPTVLVVRADSPWKTYAEFMVAVKAKPGAMSFGSSGNYGTMHVPMEQLKIATNSFMLHVPYTGAGPAVLAVLAGQVDAASTGPSSVVQQIRAGKLRALAHWGEGRLAALPEVPSLKELGVPVSYSQWAGLFVPAATPEPVVAKLRQAARMAADDARAKQALISAGSSFQYLDAPEFERFVQTDAKAMALVVQRIGRVE